ncbi:hypothetical protein LR090_03020 [Candidatus Bipolaricaulota bacterium]|nr:hypothetical protein [Candidatus Bipolaricaulota bacterium]
MRLILRADPELVKKRLEEPLGEEARAHVAGGLAKLAWEALRRGESVKLLADLTRG